MCVCVSEKRWRESINPRLLSLLKMWPVPCGLQTEMVWLQTKQAVLLLSERVCCATPLIASVLKLTVQTAVDNREISNHNHVVPFSYEAFHLFFNKNVFTYIWSLCSIFNNELTRGKVPPIIWYMSHLMIQAFDSLWLWHCWTLHTASDFHMPEDSRTKHCHQLFSVSVTISSSDILLLSSYTLRLHIFLSTNKGIYT